MCQNLLRKWLLNSLENAVSEIRSWMTENHLKLNDAKTEFLVLGKKSILKKVGHITDITVGETKVHKV